ncbi:wall-associated receptor kinase 2-like protein [Tanacetum coccineum]|uniref:Wall-associated receptor kinase 2-like protein n=1 Tax=Tanacetum coccineum TaxID=301880 RepID=A0ABQ5CNB8_9ASTR
MWAERKWVKCRPWILQNGYSLTKHDLCSDFHPPTVELWQINPFYPAVLEWSVGNTTCEEALKDERTYKCKENTVCENRESNFGYRCKCPEGFRGNAYIQNDCDQDVDECENLKLNNCLPGHCVSEGVAGAALTLILAYFLFKHRIMLKGRKDFFKQNGGIMLEKMLSTCQDPVNKLKIFTEEELNRATDNLNDTNIIGQGGNGTVYKGTLSNKILVAIKKSKVIDQSQILAALGFQIIGRDVGSHGDDGGGKGWKGGVQIGTLLNIILFILSSPAAPTDFDGAATGFGETETYSSDSLSVSQGTTSKAVVQPD